MDPKSNRFLSLDVFRGMTICFMIIVNTPGGESFAPLDHAKWFGFTPTDLVFPSFLFAVGNAMCFAMKKFIGQSDSAVVWKIVKRAALIFLVGYLMSWFPFFVQDANGWHAQLTPIGKTRILGVLQRIALCYMFASMMIYFIKSQTTIIIISIALLLGYWFLLLIYGDPSAPYGMLTNAGTYLDKYIMGDAHLYHGEGVAFDPEGILSTLPAIVNVICGYYAGKFIQEKGKNYESISKLMLVGALFIFIALSWGMTFPIAKKLWSSPFTLLTVGIDLLIISALIYIVEIQQWNRANWTAFFTTVGKNPLAVYIFSEMFIQILWMIKVSDHENINGWAITNIFQAMAPGHVGSLIYAIFYMLICWTFGKILDMNKLYLRL